LKEKALEGPGVLDLGIDDIEPAERWFEFGVFVSGGMDRRSNRGERGGKTSDEDGEWKE
jgi:hypothetical protein